MHLRFRSPLRAWQKPWACLLMAAVTVVVAGIGSLRGQDEPTSPPEADSVPTFNRDVAPIIFEHCTGCHRPNQTAPFSLMDFGDVRKRGEMIAEVTRDRYMPPWMPEPGHLPLKNERRLPDQKIETIQRWYQAGMPEGDPENKPAPPRFPSEKWPMGEPDLVLKLPEPYEMAADAPETFRNFVLPAEVVQERAIRAVDYHMASPAVHHGALLVDHTQSSRILDASDQAPGYETVETGRSVMLPGFMEGWLPGREATDYAGGRTWPLMPGDSIILNLHLWSTGKPEKVQPEVAFYYAKDPGPRDLVLLWLGTQHLEIPAGDARHVIEDAFTAPADIDILSFSPHAHLVCQSMEVSMIHSSGTKEILFRIPDWDFDWQNTYQLKQPFRVPKGSELRAKYVYDNSSGNEQNPNDPPKRIRYGPLSANEMCEMIIQATSPTSEGLTELGKAALHHYNLAEVRALQHQITRYPDEEDTAKALVRRGEILFREGQVQRAINDWFGALKIEPAHPAANYRLGLYLHRVGGTTAQREAHFRRALEARNPLFRAQVARAFGQLLMRMEKYGEALEMFQLALKLDPETETERVRGWLMQLDGIFGRPPGTSASELGR